MGPPGAPDGSRQVCFLRHLNRGSSPCEGDVLTTRPQAPYFNYYDVNKCILPIRTENDNAGDRNFEQPGVLTPSCPTAKFRWKHASFALRSRRSCVRTCAGFRPLALPEALAPGFRLSLLGKRLARGERLRSLERKFTELTHGAEPDSATPA
jgi:hypothetical protein